MYYLGVDLGGTNIKAALVDADGAIIKEASTPTKLPRPAEAVCDDIAALCNQLAQGQQVAGIGVGCPGTVDGGLVRYSNNLDWHDFAMGDYLRARTGLPVALANDANAAAQGDAAGKAVVEQYIHYLAVGVANMINIFFPEVIGLSGGVANQGENLLAPLRAAVGPMVFGNAYAQKHTRITTCTLGYRAGVIGAALLAKNQG